MGTLRESGINFILYIQSFQGPFLDGFFSFVTQLGGTAYLLLIPLIIWCIAPRLGLRATLAMLIAQFIVMVMKDYFGQPRPFLMDDRIVSDGEWGLSFPSGHAQGAMVYYGLIAAAVARRWVTILMGVIIFLIGFSRSYLGVHYPHDVVAGWLIGAALLYTWLTLEDSSASFFRELSTEMRFLSGILLPFALAALHNYFWSNPSTFMIAGAISGTIFCLASPSTQAFSDGRDSLWRRFLRLAVGMLLLLILVQAIRYAWPEGEGLAQSIWVFLDGIILMLFIGLAAPRLFGWIRLSPARVD